MNEASDERIDDSATVVKQDETLPDALYQDEPEVIDGLKVPNLHPRTAPKPVKLSIIKHSEMDQSFRKHSEEQFSHEDSNWIGWANGFSFLWEWQTATSNIVRIYWAKNYCLELEPLQIEADIRMLIDRHPVICALILLQIMGRPVEIAGARHARGQRSLHLFNNL